MTSRRLLPPSLALLALVAAGCGGGSSGGGSSATNAGTISVKDSSLGKILVDGSGRTVYLFEKDKGTRSACAGACAGAWPPLTVSGTPKAGSGVSARLLGTTRRSDGTMEVTYNGHPLYRFSGDSKAGDTNGEGSKAFGAEWYALSSGGAKVEGNAGSSSGGGGGSGY